MGEAERKEGVDALIKESCLALLLPKAFLFYAVERHRKDNS